MSECWQLGILGASSTFTPPTEANASLCLSNGNRLILIDTGGNVPALLKTLEEDVRNITDVIITHGHPDHTYGFPFLSHSFYSGQQSIRCWSSSESIQRLKDSLDAYDLRGKERYLDVTFEEINTESPEKINLVHELEIETIPIKHSRPGFGLSIRSKRQSLIYSGDTAPTDTLKEIATGSDVLIHDCQATHGYKRYFGESHTSARELGALAAEAEVGLLVPFHYNITEFPITRHEIVREIRQFYNGSVVFPHRGMGFYL